MADDTVRRLIREVERTGQWRELVRAMTGEQLLRMVAELDYMPLAPNSQGMLARAYASADTPLRLYGTWDEFDQALLIRLSLWRRNLPLLGVQHAVGLREIRSSPFGSLTPIGHAISEIGRKVASSPPF